MGPGSCTFAFEEVEDDDDDGALQGTTTFHLRFYPGQARKATSELLAGPAKCPPHSRNGHANHEKKQPL